MDVLYFLKVRTEFIRQFYETAGEPFQEIMRQIEAEEPPYDPPYSEDGEPVFLDEWLQANDGLQILGRTCLSMLSPTLQLYFKIWESELRIEWSEGERKRAFKNGFLRGYQRCFGEALDLPWAQCPADLALIEQVTLARNRDQHPDQITSMQAKHSKYDLEKYPHPFFVSEFERRMCTDPETDDAFWMTPAVHVSREGLFMAIDEVEKLAEWLEQAMLGAKYRR